MCHPGTDDFGDVIITVLWLIALSEVDGGVRKA